MKSIVKFIFVTCLTAILLTACEKDYKYERNIKLLTKNIWQIKTFVNYAENQTTITRNAKFYFKENNELVKIYDNGEIATAKWELSQDANFLLIGNNMFKITELSRRVMSLRHGDAEIFFIPIKE
ncbi:MAG TPA: hypothetical protein PLW77_00685 [Bacteroidales bacterium]|nr:hypothetical protein [Bacteroidales bacterium]HQB20885.1 hypothetical protein [Bacteroidales bacterium]